MHTGETTTALVSLGLQTKCPMDMGSDDHERSPTSALIYLPNCSPLCDLGIPIDFGKSGVQVKLCLAVSYLAFCLEYLICLLPASGSRRKACLVEFVVFFLDVQLIWGYIILSY